MTEVEPSVSTECNRFTMAFCFAIFEIPIARVTVTTAGSPSGIAATARATAPRIAVVNDSPTRSCTMNTTVAATPAMMARVLLSASSCRSSGVLEGFADTNNSATFPISVVMPVLVTTTSARPRLTVVFMNTIPMRSPMGPSATVTASARFSTGTDSPVSEDSSTDRFAANIRRPSAGTRSPASRRTRSPGTSWSIATSSVSPFRRTHRE